MHAEDIEDLTKKIDSNHYNILAVRGNIPTPITRATIKEIVDLGEKQ